MPRRKTNNFSDKKELRKYINTSIRTTMIGALAAFEEHFGHLWGHDHSSERSEEEEYYYVIWQDARKQILDLGNNSIDIANRSTNRFNVSQKGFYNDYFSG